MCIPVLIVPGPGDSHRNFAEVLVTAIARGARVHRRICEGSRGSKVHRAREPVELPDRAAVEVLLPEKGGMTALDRADLELALDESVAEIAREVVDARAFALGLVAKS